MQADATNHMREFGEQYVPRLTTFLGFGVYQPGSFIRKFHPVQQNINTSSVYLTIVNKIDKTDVQAVVKCVNYPWFDYKTEDDCLINVSSQIYTG